MLEATTSSPTHTDTSCIPQTPDTLFEAVLAAIPSTEDPIAAASRIYSSAKKHLYRMHEAAVADLSGAARRAVTVDCDYEVVHGDDGASFTVVNICVACRNPVGSLYIDSEGIIDDLRDAGDDLDVLALAYSLGVAMPEGYEPDAEDANEELPSLDDWFDDDAGGLAALKAALRVIYNFADLHYSTYGSNHSLIAIKPKSSAPPFASGSETELQGQHA